MPVWLTVTPRKLAKYMADRLDTHSPPPEIGVMITFAANTRSEVFLAGPNILSRTLNLPSNSTQTWIDTHRPKILNAARTKMREYPPRSQKRTVYVTLKEYCTETWRTMMVKTDSDPRALLLILTRSSDSESASWVLAGGEHPSTNILASFGNSFVTSIFSVLMADEGPLGICQ